MKRWRLIIPSVLLVGTLVPANAKSLLCFAAQSKVSSSIEHKRIGQIAVEGAKAFSTAQIIKLSGLKAGAVANPEIIRSAVARLERAYANRGYLKARVSISPQPKADSAPEKHGVVDVAVQIEEGAVFVLRRLEFYGNAMTRDRIVRRRVACQEGAPFSPAWLERSVQQLNGLGLFERITTANVKVELNEQEHFVDLLFTLKEKQKRTDNRR